MNHTAKFEVPQRNSLTSQTHRIIVEGIQHGRWRKRLPGERSLSEELQVSRWTIRNTLTMLAREKRIRVTHGQSSEILLAPRRKSGKAEARWRIGCIIPEPIERLRPSYLLWIDDLRTRLQAAGGQLSIYDGKRFYRNGGEKALAQLVSSSPHAGWFLLLSSRAMQQWFKDNGVPVLIAGSSFAGVELPSLDFDHHAVALHAANTLLTSGHRRIMLLKPKTIPAGLVAAEEGFREAVARYRAPDIQLSVVTHEFEPDSIRRALDRFLSATVRPTAISIMQPGTLLTAIPYLAYRGVMIPRDVSVVATCDEPYVGYIYPSVTRYFYNQKTYARQFFKQIMLLRAAELAPTTRVRLLPDFVRGETLRRLG